MLKLFFQISLISISLILFSCKDNSVDPKNDKTSIVFKITNTNSENHQGIFNDFISKISSQQNNGLLKTSGFDEMRIICLDMTKWNNISDFFLYWNNGGRDFIDQSLYDSTKDRMDNYSVMIKKYPGDAFEYIGDYSFTVKDSIATGTIYLNPGLNYFMYAFRKNGCTGVYGETSAIIVKDSINNIELNYVNTKPATPSSPHPPLYATGVFRTITLRWVCSDPDFDPIKYDVYFGQSVSPPSVALGVIVNEYNPGTLLPNTTYYWRIDASDDHGNLRTGITWTFTTGL